MKKKPFDLEYYLSNEPGIVTRDGREITQIRIYENLKYISYRVKGEEKIFIAGLSGKAYGKKKELDIFMYEEGRI